MSLKPEARGSSLGRFIRNTSKLPCLLELTYISSSLITTTERSSKLELKGDDNCTALCHCKSLDAKKISKSLVGDD